MRRATVAAGHAVGPDGEAPAGRGRRALAMRRWRRQLAKRRRRRPSRSSWLCLVVALAVSAMVPAGAVAGSRSTWPGGVYAGLEDRLEAIVQDARDNGVPGVSAAIETADGLWTGVAGRASLRPVRQVTRETAFEAGSVTKTFVAAVVLRLVEDGRLSLSSRLSRWMPDFPYARSITIRQLLSHTSGIRDLFDDPANQRYLERHKGKRFGFREIVRRIGRPWARPGSGYRYSNANYVLLGRIVERVTGRGIAAVIRSELLEPLGLTHTWFQGEEPAPPGMSDRRAMGYAVGGRAYGDGSGLRPYTSMATFVWAAGAMMSTPTDLARWARALYGGRVLSASSLERMVDFGPKGYGLGARGSVKGDREAWGHGGSLDGYQTGMWYLPAIDASVVVMWNRWPHDTRRVTDRLAERLVDRLDPDITPPVAGAPRIGIRRGVQASIRSVWLDVAWSRATEDKGTIAGYQLERSVEGGPWARVSLDEASARGVADRVRPGEAVRYRVRAINDEGLRSGWATSAAVRPEVIDEGSLDDAAWDGGWSTVASDGSIGGRVRRSTTKGSVVRFAAEGVRAMAVVLTRASTRGAVQVRWDGSRPGTTVDLGIRPKAVRWVASSARWGGARTHEVVVTVRSGGETTDVDGFVILSDAG